MSDRETTGGLRRPGRGPGPVCWPSLRSSIGRSIDPLGEAVVRMRCWPNDLDLNMHMSAGRYLTAMDVGRVAYIARTGVFRKAMKRGWRPINGGTMIRYRKSLLAFERFTVRTRCLAWDEKWFYFEHRIDNARGELSAIANARALLRGPEGNVPPAEVFALTGRSDLVSPEIPASIAKWMEAEALR